MEYEHLCEACNKEFDLEYGIKDPVPTTCILCGVEGKVKRLISGGNGRGVVYLTGHELTAKLQADGKKIQAEAMRNETVLADIIGHDKLQANTVAEERVRANIGRPRFRTKK